MIWLRDKNSINFSSKNSGFTILELLIATTVFSVIILIVATGVIKIGNIYYKNITSSRTQDTVRSIVDEVTASVQLNTNKTDVNTNKFCLGNIRYTSYINTTYLRSDTGNKFSSGIVAEDLASGSTCAGTNTVCASSGDTNCIKQQRQLLGNNMRPLKFAVGQYGSTSDLWQVSIKIAYGDSDLLNITNPDPSGTTCKSGAGSNFCAVAGLDTVVKTRVQ